MWDDILIDHDDRFSRMNRWFERQAREDGVRLRETVGRDVALVRTANNAPKNG